VAELGYAADLKAAPTVPDRPAPSNPSEIEGGEDGDPPPREAPGSSSGGPFADSSGAAPNPRAALVVQLAAAVGALASVGDLDGARVASEALSKLLGATGEAAPVVDLAERRRRGPR
jgi:hypothetical protein